MAELDKFWTELSPPPGGLARLREQVQARRPVQHRGLSRRRYRWALAAAIALLLMGPGTLELVARHRLTSAWVKALGGSDRPRYGGIEVAHGAALALPSNRPGVSIYFVYSEPPARAPSGGG